MNPGPIPPNKLAFPWSRDRQHRLVRGVDLVFRVCYRRCERTSVLCQRGDVLAYFQQAQEEGLEPFLWGHLVVVLLDAGCRHSVWGRNCGSYRGDVGCHGWHVRSRHTDWRNGGEWRSGSIRNGHSRRARSGRNVWRRRSSCVHRGPRCSGGIKSHTWRSPRCECSVDLPLLSGLPLLSIRIPSLLATDAPRSIVLNDSLVLLPLHFIPPLPPAIALRLPPLPVLPP
jgi:hypothetical protein